MKTFLVLISGFATVLFFSFFNKNQPQTADNQLVMANSSKIEIAENPVELGKINWSRDYDASKKEAISSKKPLLVLFQEVPGCSNCTRFGNVVLSHPLLVEAVETYFVPVCIFNNKGGEDKRILEKFGEPAWNNPVVRILDAEFETDLAPRISNSYTPFTLATEMLETIKKRDKNVPNWLILLEKSLRADEKGTEETVVSMSCFWSGEGKIGAMSGVVATEAGFMGGQEVVRVEFDPTEISLGDFLKKSKESGCASTVFCEKSAEKMTAEKTVGANSVAEKTNFRPDREPKYYLSQTNWRFVPMTEMQAARANSLIGQNQSPISVFSPRQVELESFISKNLKKKWKNRVGSDDLIKSWAECERLKNEA
jgi:hypothetical protein